MPFKSYVPSLTDALCGPLFAILCTATHAQWSPGCSVVTQCHYSTLALLLMRSKAQTDSPAAICVIVLSQGWALQHEYGS